MFLFAGIAVLISFCVYAAGRRYYAAHEAERLLSRIPTVRFKVDDNDRFQYLHHHRELIRSGYAKHTKHGEIFKVKNATGDWKVILPREYLMEIKHAAGNTLSWQKTMGDVMMLKYTGGPDRAAWSARALRVEVTKRLDSLEPDMLKGVEVKFSPDWFIPKDGKFHTVHLHSFFIDCIARITNSIFSGPELAADPEWIEATQRFTKNAWAAASEVRLEPPWRRWPATLWLPKIKAVAADKRMAREKIGPVFRERVAGMKGQRGDWKSPHDGFQWLLNTSGPDVDFHVFVDTLMRIMMASIHITAAQATLALANMLCRPDCIPMLQEECQKNVENNEEVTSLVRLTSFMKESMRHSSSGVTLAGRKAVVPHVFRDGTMIPVGTVMWAPVEAINHDADIYPDPESFDGLRFYNLRQESKEADHKWELANAHEDFVNFGYGTQACPGRWFAERELCLIFRKLFTEYEMVGDWQDEDEKKLAPPKAQYIDNTLQPPDLYSMKVRYRTA